MIVCSISQRVRSATFRALALRFGSGVQSRELMSKSQRPTHILTTQELLALDSPVRRYYSNVYRFKPKTVSSLEARPEHVFPLLVLLYLYWF